MANPHGNPQNLKRTAGPGRPKKAQLPSRNELLELLIKTPGEMQGSKTLLDDARKRFHEILVASNSSASIEWLFNQLIGSPKSTIKHEIPSTAVFIALGETLAEDGYTEETAKDFVTRLISKLKGDVE